MAAIIITGAIMGTIMSFVAITLGTLSYHVFFGGESALADPMRLFLLISISWFGFVYIFGPINAYVREKTDTALWANSIFIILPVILGLFLAYGVDQKLFWHGLTASSIFSGYNIAVSFAKRA